MKPAYAILPTFLFCALLATSCASTAQFDYDAAPGAIPAYAPLPGSEGDLRSTSARRQGT